MTSEAEVIRSYRCGTRETLDFYHDFSPELIGGLSITSVDLIVDDPDGDLTIVATTNKDPFVEVKGVSGFVKGKTYLISFVADVSSGETFVRGPIKLLGVEND